MSAKENSIRIWFGMCGAALLMMGVVGPLSWPYNDGDTLSRIAWHIAIGSAALGTSYLGMSFALPWLVREKAYLLVPLTSSLILLAMVGLNVGGVLIGIGLLRGVHSLARDMS